MSLTKQRLVIESHVRHVFLSRSGVDIARCNRDGYTANSVHRIGIKYDKEKSTSDYQVFKVAIFILRSASHSHHRLKTIGR